MSALVEYRSLIIEWIMFSIKTGTCFDRREYKVEGSLLGMKTWKERNVEHILSNILISARNINSIAI